MNLLEHSNGKVVLELDKAKYPTRVVMSDKDLFLKEYAEKSLSQPKLTRAFVSPLSHGW